MDNSEEGKVLRPEIHPSVFIAEGARIYGDVVIGEESSVWFNAVIRGDEGRISIGRSSNIQDNAVLHSDMMVGIEIGDEVTVGHGTIVRGCRIGNNVMVGMNSTLMTNAVIGEDSIIGAHSFVPYDKHFPPRSLIIGSPARVVRELSDQEVQTNRMAVDIYRELIRHYTQGLIVGHESG